VAQAADSAHLRILEQVGQSESITGIELSPYTFCQVDGSRRFTPAMAAGRWDHVLKVATDYGMRLLPPRRDKRTVYLQEVAIYEIVAPLIFLRIGIPPFWFFAFQALAHLISALVSNKFYWWYGKKASTGLSRILLIAAACGWGVAGCLFSLPAHEHAWGRTGWAASFSIGRNWN